MRRTMARHVILVAAVVSLASGLPYATTGVSAQDGAGTESGEDPNAGVGDVGDALGGGSGDGSGEAAEGTTGEGEATDMGEGASDDAAPVGGTEGG
ncbi:MAG TPA: hypothetical protein RMI62_11825, partial [Polyangiaceae bacterium LLY-WYZ-15_(1-7)]|nr:hypothetical protein [Polyangiaceae bacterium LLY-WYZ-15_(1-7)]